MNLRKILIYISMITIVLSQQSCGGDTLSKDVTITLIPESPIVQASPYTATDSSGSSVDISPPWFGLRYKITNGAKKTLVVSTFVAEIITTDSSGTKSTTTYTPDFGLYDSDRYQITMTSLATGDSFTEPKYWPFQSLPDNGNFSYRVKITFTGYFEKLDEALGETVPGERFKKVLTFTTQ